MNSTVPDLFEMIVAPQTSPWFHYITGIVLLITNIGSALTNGSVLFVLFVKNRKLLTRANQYIATVCLISFTMSVFGAPMVVVSCFNEGWLFGDTGCKYYAFLMSYGGLTSMLLLCMDSVDKYIYVVKRELSSRLTSNFSISAITGSSAVALGFAVGPLVGWNQYIYEGIGTACAIDTIGENNNGQSFVISLLIVFFVLPVSVMIFSYGSIYVKVITESKGHLRSNCKRTRMNQLTMEKELAITVIIIIGFFLLCYSPYAILLFWKILNKDVTMDPMLMAIPSMMTKIGGIFTPFVYLGRNKNIRQQVLDLYAFFKQSGTVTPDVTQIRSIGPPHQIKIIIKKPTLTEIECISKEITEYEIKSEDRLQTACQSHTCDQHSDQLDVISTNRHFIRNVHTFLPDILVSKLEPKPEAWT
ncbi:rhodopsin-like [Mytilus galloprovincialis]|uniref:rhodopsin-like n=1 Tax=Mytilus galloprovincialis TaxID=29158 RepID=UPI003F7BACCA